MTDENWTSETNEAPPKKKGLPKWLMFLGCGCLTMVLLAAAGGALLYKSMEGIADPEVQWPALAEVLPYEGEHPDLMIIGMPFAKLAPGIDNMWVLTNADTGHTATIYLLSGESGQEMADQLLSAEAEVDLPFVGGVQNLEEVTVMVQGRELRAVRFTSFNEDDVSEEDLAKDEDEGFMGEMNRALKKAAMRIDVSQEDGGGTLVLIEYAKAGTLDAVTDEDINAFLTPFEIGPDR